MDEEQGICRVCRCGPSHEQPLFYPCKCAGSIRFIHQQCLIEWLSHSKKKYCELCDHPFVFTPIYRGDMPKRIPIDVLLRQFTLRLLYTFNAIFRFMVVIVVWFILLPLSTLIAWRFYLWSGNSIGAYHQHSVPTEESFLLIRYSQRFFISDCIEGLILTVVVVIVLVAVYLFRDWVIKNTAHTPSIQNIQHNALSHGSNNSIEDVNQNMALTDHGLPGIRLNENRRVSHGLVNMSDHGLVNRFEQLREGVQGRRRVLMNNDRNIRFGTEDDYRTEQSSTILFPGTAGYYEHRNRNRLNFINSLTDDSSDDETMPSLQSGTQSPFASWRDYQQQESEDYLTSRRDSNDNNEYEHRRSISGTWRAREFSRNVRERTGHVLDQEMVVEDDQREQSSSPHTTHHPPPEEENRAFDLLQQRATRAANEHPQEEVVREEDEIFDILENTDGILEAIGIHGNPIMLFQNFILMSIMINLCLGVTIWIPYVIGRFVILIFIPKLLGMLMYTLSVSTYPFVSIIRYYTYKLHPMNHASTMMPDSVWSLLEHIRQLSADFASSTIMKSLFDRISGLMDPLRLIINTMADMWTQFPVDQSNFNRILCIHLGYSVLISIGSWYLSKTKNVRAASTNEILRQQGVFLKVLTFILTEIVLFPLICGILLDISTLPLFKDCTFHDRLVFVSMNPFSGTFLHWFAGTGFIFNFSVFISLVREVVRPGVLWFIRDPKDLQFQPVQDIVNQPLLVLLKKLWTFAVIYFMLIMVGMGVVTLFVSKYASIYPIIWSFNIPISTLPIDLVAIHLLLSYTINYIVPREQAKQAVNTWWHIVSKQLRLTSFMFGGKYEEEEIRGHHSWKEWVFGTRSDKRSPITDEVDIFNITESIVYKKGGFARVPAYDNVPIFTNRRMIVPVNPITFQPLNRMEKATGHPATSQPGNESIDTIVVYLPPYFKLRIMIFLFLIWLTASILVCSVSIVPLLLGRHLLSKVIIPDKPVHDFYAFTAGAYAMIMMSSSLNWIVQKHKTLEDGHCIDIVSIRDYLAQVTYRIFMFLKMVTVSGILIPFLVGLILDLYIFTPLRLSKYKDAVVINLTEDWIMGVILLNVFVGLINVLPNTNPFQSVFSDTQWQQIKNVNPYKINAAMAMKVILILTMNITLPGLLAIITFYIFGIDNPLIKILIFRCVYPVLFCGICCIFITLFCIRLVRLYIQNIIDDTYLIGKRLHNLEE